MGLPQPNWSNQQFADFYAVAPRTITRWRAAAVNLMDPEEVLGRLLMSQSPSWPAISAAESALREHRLRKRSRVPTIQASSDFETWPIPTDL